MKTANEILKEKNLLWAGDSNCDGDTQDVIDAMHEFANQFKNWIKIDGNNWPKEDVEVIVFVPDAGQLMGACKKDCYWYSTRTGEKINPTHYHYQLQNPQ